MTNKKQLLGSVCPVPIGMAVLDGDAGALHALIKADKAILTNREGRSVDELYGAEQRITANLSHAQQLVHASRPAARISRRARDDA